MAKLQFITSPESNYSLGIDSRSSEDKIAAGFVKDLLNADIIEGRVRKRVGSQGYSGNLPVRVTTMEYLSTGILQLTLDSAVALTDTTVDLTTTRSSPLVVYGRSSIISSGGPFTTSGDSARYYPAFVVPTRKTFLATSSAPPYETVSVPASEHGISSTDIFVSVVESTSQVDKSYTLALPNTVDISTSTDDIDVTYQNSTGTDRGVYVYYKDRSPVAGQAYVATLTHGGAGSQTFSVAAGTHGLDNYNIVVQVQQDLGATYQIVQPQVVITSAGTVQITIDSVTAGTYYALLSATDPSNSMPGSVAGGVTSTITISALTSPWIFYGVYIENTPGGDRELVYPDSIAYSDSTQEAVLTFTNSQASAANFWTYYEYGSIRGNRLQITDSSVTVNATDTRPQLTIWGLDHSEIYGATPAGRSGWVTHVDSYKSAGDRRLVAGLGGNLFTSRTYDEEANSHLYPLLYPRLQARTSTALVLGPLLYDTGDTPGRTRGYITADASGTGWGRVTSVAYDSGTGYTLYTISLPSKAILDSTGTPTTLSSVVSTTAGLEDYLTITDMSYSRHNGTFRILAVSDGTDEIVVSCEVAGGSSDYDDTGTYGAAGIFTDQITWLTSSPFVAGDTIHNAALGDTALYTVTSSLGAVTVVSGATDRLDLAGGLVTTGRRTSSLVPLRSALPGLSSSVTNLVRGDMLSYSEVDRLLRVLSVRADTDRTVDIVVDPLTLTATVTLLSGDTYQMVEGGRVLLLQAGDFSGTQVVQDILTPTSFTVTALGTEADVSGATLVGNLVEIDEDLQWEDATGDSIYFWTERRWVPIEAPDDNYDLTPSTYVRYLDSRAYGDQDFLRSTTVVDNMYLTNYTDEVQKFDGTSIYRAGLPSWQPGLFVTQDTSASAKIVTGIRNLAYSARSAALGQLTVTAQDQGILPVGATVRLSGSIQTYTVRDYTNDGTSYYLLLDRSLDSGVSASGTAAEIATYRYYFRLSAIDANDNVVSSAVTGYQDHVVELTADAAVQLRLVGLPAWDNYDYDRLEVEIYRTKKSLSAPFYRVTTLQMDFDRTQGYLTYTDVFSDSDLLELDTVSTALKGTELGVQWQEPLRAKYVTSIGNRLVLAGLRDYPQIDLQVVASGAVTAATYSGKRWLLRKDSNDTGTTTNMVDRVAYETVDTATGTASAFSAGAGQFSFTTSIDHSATLTEGDWIYLSYSSVATTGRDLSYSGWWQVASVSTTTVTVSLVGAASASSYPDNYTIATASTDVPVLLGTDGNLGQVNGDSFDLFDLTRRLSLAVNSSMRMVDTSLTGMSGYVPWIMARSGNDVGKSGRIVLRRPRAAVAGETPELVLPSSFSGAGLSFEVFTNDIRRSPSENVSAVTRLYPSRILASYENYPEIMDNPLAVLDTESDSALDINSADGQEITGVIPFFGEAAFGAAQQSGILVVFKSNSIYLVDLNEKAAGRNPIHRIETEGLGCTAPYSIAATKGGIVFANESGIYCLRRDQSIHYMGRYMERNWTERVNLDLLSVAQGHHYGVGRMYKLSVPLVGDTANSEVYVYNHTNEDLGTGTLGAWSRYDSHPATGWANLDTDAFWSSTQGRVLSLRRTGTTSDYRDSSDPVQFRLDTRATDLGNAGIRKVLDALVVYYRVLQTETGTSVSFSIDTAQEYLPTTAFTVRKSRATSGIDDGVARDVIAILHNTERRRGVQFQIRVENSTLDENLEITGIELRVAGLSERGISQAARSR